MSSRTLHPIHRDTGVLFTLSASYPTGGGSCSRADSTSCIPDGVPIAVLGMGLQCGPGTYSQKGGWPPCIPCAPGHFGALSGALSCASCPLSTFQVAPASSSCERCAPHPDPAVSLSTPAEGTGDGCSGLGSAPPV
eukprot:3932305-Rhodomonas_salina.3